MKAKLREQLVPEPYVARVGAAFARALWHELDVSTRPNRWQAMHGRKIFDVRIEICADVPLLHTYMKQELT